MYGDLVHRIVSGTVEDGLVGMKRRVGGGLRTPAFGIVVLTPILLAGAVAASPGRSAVPVSSNDVTPLASVEVPQPESHGMSVVAMARPPADFRFAANTVYSPPPPPAVVSAVGGMRIPAMALSAYRKAEQTMAAAAPGCGVSWNLLAGIGRIESSHANGGATDARGTAVRPIYGPALDGSLPGNEIIVQSNMGGRAHYARALGPMQFLPGTWSRYASDGDGDGRADPQNLFDATLSAARYLCSGGLNLRNQAQVLTAILRYNNSMPYAQNVLGWAAAYATGVAPVDLPAISGPVPALGDVHLEKPEGLGPGMQGDPLSQLPLFNLGNTELAGQMAMPGPGAGAAGALGVLPEHGCQVICMASQLPPAAETPDLPPWMMPMAPAPWMTPPTAAAPVEAAPLPGLPPAPGLPPGPAAPGLPPAPDALPGLPPAPAAPGLPPGPDALPAPEPVLLPPTEQAPPTPILGAPPGPA